MMGTPLSHPREVLLVEDSATDALLTRRGFESAGLPMKLTHVENGEECLAYLRKEGRYAEVTTPDLVLLDLNMPRMDGREVLTEIVADEKLRRIPVVILTTSEAERDILDMYQLRCSSYITKPVDYDQFRRVIEEFGSYWLSLAKLPPPRN